MCLSLIVANSQGWQPAHPYRMKVFYFIGTAIKYKKLLTMPAGLVPANLTDTGLLRLHQEFLRPALRGGLCNMGSGWVGGAGRIKY